MKKINIDTKLIVKSIAYRTFSLLITIFVAYFFSGSTTVALSVGFVDSMFKIIYYYIFDKTWSKFKI